jgi:transposase-like protein
LAHHFLLSAKARTLGLSEITRLSDEDAYASYKAVRFADNGGEPFCPDPKCACPVVYEFKRRRIFKCKRCERQFSLTSGTLFADHKLSFRQILTAIILCVNGVNGYPAVRLSRDLNVSVKCAYVLLHKFRKAMGAMQAGAPLTGEVEIDGIWLGGHVRPLNLKEDQKELIAKKRKAAKEARRLGEGTPPNKNAEKQYCIVTFKERRKGGRSRSLVFKREEHAVGSVYEQIDPKAKLITDGGQAWGALGVDFERDEVIHSVGFMVNGVHINCVESYHSRSRRGERGVYLHMAGRHLQNYADEFSWREDHRRVSNGQQYQMLLAAAAPMPSAREWVGLWQKREKRAA